MYADKKIPVSKLLLDQNNPRYEPTGSQEEAIRTMLNNDTDKILTMSKHILENGVNLSVRPIIYINPDGENIVKDGNRRITCLKIINNPRLIPKEFMKLRKTMNDLRKDHDLKDLRTVNCIVTDDEELADSWVQNNHQGPQEGIGQVMWNSIQKARNRRNKGSNEPILEIYEWVKETLGKKIVEDSFSLDILKRVVTADEFKKFTGIDVTKHPVTIEINVSDFKKVMDRVFDDIIQKKINTRKLQSIDQRNEYASGLIKDHPGIERTGNEIEISVQYMQTSKPTTGKKKVVEDKRKKKPSELFDTLEFSSLDVDDNDQKAFYYTLDELVRCSANMYRNYPLAVGFLVRASYEQSMHLVLKKLGCKNLVSLTKLSTKEKELSKMIEDSRAKVLSEPMKTSFKNCTMYREFLNCSIHEPEITKTTETTLKSMAVGGMRTFLQESIDFITDRNFRT